MKFIYIIIYFLQECGTTECRRRAEITKRGQTKST